MMKRITIALAAAALFAGGVLAAPAIAGDQPAAASPDAARVGAAPEGKAQIVFFRPTAAGFLLSFSVHEGDKGVVKLGNNTYQVIPIDPGTHTFMIESEAKDTLTLEAEAGETYYVKQTMAMGLLVGHPHLNLSDEASFNGIRSLKLSTLKATDKHGAATPDTTAAK